MSTKLVICGYGWLGSHIGNAMLSTHEVIATTRTVSKAQQLAQKNIQSIVYSLGDDTSVLDSAFCGATLILNIPPGRKNTQLDDFIHNMLALIESATNAGVKRIIFISTTSVYGDTHNNIVVEDSNIAPQTASAKAHAAIEKYLIDKVQQAYIVRLSGLTGPNRHPVTSLSGRSLPAGNKRVNLVHVQDVVSAIKVMVNSSPEHRIYHLCASTHPKRGDYYSRAAIKKGIAPPSFSDTELAPTGKLIVADNSWAYLGITPQYTNVDDMV